MALNIPPFHHAATGASVGSLAPLRSGRIAFFAVEQWSASILALALFLCALAAANGVDLTADTPTQISCLALLVLGIPHGTFDWRILQQGLTLSTERFARRLVLYLILAVATFLLWKAASVLALTSFLILAAFHFGEDGLGTLDEAGQSATTSDWFMALSIPVSLMTIPALDKPEMMQALFATLTQDGSSKYLVDAMILLAPVATAIALVKIFVDLTSGRSGIAIAGILILSGMLLLPPIVGFALYFCLYHSPLNFASALRKPVSATAHSDVLMIVGLSVIGLAIALIVYLAAPAVSASDKLIHAAFVTLSLLTVPHMLMPNIARSMQRRGW